VGSPVVTDRPMVLVGENRRVSLGLALNRGIRLVIAYAQEISPVRRHVSQVCDFQLVRCLVNVCKDVGLLNQDMPENLNGLAFRQGGRLGETASRLRCFSARADVLMADRMDRGSLPKLPSSAKMEHGRM
jgi:hypothetical protein